MKWVKIWNFKYPGPTTLVIGLLHGNEVVGKHAIAYLHKKIQENPKLGWKIISLLGNLKAHKADKRFIDSDLNRVFDKAPEKWNYEITRAHEIKKFFADIHIDYVFDLHSTSSKSAPMILCTSQKSSLLLASKMPIKYVVQWLIDIIDETGLIKYFQKRIKLGMAFECGFHKDPKTLLLGEKIIDNILDFHQQKPMKKKKNQIKIKITDIVYTSDHKFVFTKPYKWFEQLKKWEIRWIDKTWKHSFNKPKILVMPNMIIAEELEKKSQARVAYFWDRII